MAVAFEMDESAFPVVLAAFRGPVKMAALDALGARLDSFCAERRRFSLVIDLTQGTVPSAGERKHIAEAITARRIALGRHCAGAAIVVENPLIRGAMTAIFWIQPLPYPHEMVTTKEDGRVACARWLRGSPARSGVA